MISEAAPASAGAQKSPGTQSAYRPPVVAVSRLQVTGTAAALSVDAERADVQSTLKAILKQAGNQFAPDTTVAGQVTLTLTDQPIETVLQTVCDTTYLRFTVSTSGIYRFTRDDAAIKRAFSQLKELNSQLRAQLRALGMDVPPDERLLGLRVQEQSALYGGLGGAASGRQFRSNAKQDAKPQGNAVDGPPISSVLANTAVSRAPNASVALNATNKESLGKIANIHTDFIAQNDLPRVLAQDSLASGLSQQSYGLLLRQNGFVWFNIPEEKPEPVTSVLQLFSQQSNVPVLVDQAVPNGLKFRVWGNLSPRQLPEALNLLAPTAHLQWRWIGNSIYVVPAPNFTIYFGDQGSGRSAYPAPAQGETNGSTDTRERRGGSD